MKSVWTRACGSILQHKYFGLLSCLRVHVRVRGGARARQPTVWGLMASGKVLYALAAVMHYE